MSEVSKSLIVTFDALNLVKGIKSIGGPDKQVYYIESDVFAPDRRITPLILQPYLIVEDPHEIIPNGNKISELSSAKWYFDEIKSENRITAKEEDASIDTPFALGVNNSLHIRKNVEKAIQLFFEAEYLDIRKNKNIHISLTYLLTTTQSSEVKPAPKLKLSKPQSWNYCPLDKITEATIEAEVFADNKGYKSAVEWRKVENNKEIPLSDEPFVLGGQNSNKLVVNPDVMGDTLLRARNLSEEVYNRFYGINPEWDGRMSEVMENRNLFVGKRWKTNFIDAEKGNILYEVIKVEPNKVYTVTTDAEEIDGIDSVFVDIKKGDFPSSGGKLRVTRDIPRTITTDEQGVLVLYLRHQNISGKVVKADCFANLSRQLKIEVGSIGSPYTPAPEDLNYRNLGADGLKRHHIPKHGWDALTYKITEFCNPNDEVYFNYLVTDVSEGVTHTDTRISNGDNKNHGSLLIEIIKGKPTSGILIPDVICKEVIIYLNKMGDFPKDGYINVLNFFLVNLTEKFGAGNEPTKEQCDEIFAEYGYIPAPEDLAKDGIIKGSYQSDIKFTKYFPEINAEILFLTGDSIRPEHKTIKAQAIFTTNKEPIDNPSEFFDIEWFIDPIEAGGESLKIGTGEFMEISVSELPLKGGRLVPIRLKYNFK